MWPTNLRKVAGLIFGACAVRKKSGCEQRPKKAYCMVQKSGDFPETLSLCRENNGGSSHQNVSPHRYRAPNLQLQSLSLIIALRLQAAAWDLVCDSGEARHFAATTRRYFPDRLTVSYVLN
ncbi:unnamed protein product [Bursaphelenchus xylophilus]|uniref:(pine wood nematode) hypothetical protein n=1 Tax=Bursaphelenchus xylophilus TaxID=6326 RepID=A0A1I7SBY6_BURXY|nr:unnamed protein product [Bursaphelenchus xylophilus]CAG9089050.1 unnamed protein product [Bursaphelenchus xylophilus]